MSTAVLDKYEYQVRWERAGFKSVWDPFTGQYKLGLNMEPYKSFCDGYNCPCNKGHDLEPTKEAIVEYKGQPWAFHCAIQQAVMDASNVLIEVMWLHDQASAENKRVVVGNAQLRECIQDLANLVKETLKHDEDCILSNPAAVMRGRTDCNCNFKASKKIIDNVIAKADGIV